MIQGLQIRLMTSADWPRVRAIFEEGIASGHATFETTSPDWETWDLTHHQHSRFVATVSGYVVGWIALSPVSLRECYAGVAEVSYYIAAEFRGMGVGRTLLDYAIASSEQNGIWTLTAGIFPENIASERLLFSHGFRLVGRRERIGAMNGVWRDTLLFERRSAVVG